MINIVDWKTGQHRDLQTKEERRTPNRLKLYYQQNSKDNISEGLLLQCMRLWKKEKKNRDQLCTLKILNPRDHSTKNTELHVLSLVQEDQQFPNLSCLPSINLKLSDEKMEESIQLQDDYEAKMFGKTKNMFRVRLSPHTSKSKSIPSRSVHEDNINELNINLKTISNRSDVKDRKIMQQRRTNQTLSHYCESKLKRMSHTIKIDDELMLKDNDFILSPW